MQGTILVFGLIVLAITINIPCGYARQNFPKFSVMWWFLIHLPIPFIVLLRSEAGLNWHYIPITLLSSIVGQVLGGVMYRRRQQNGNANDETP